MAKPDKRKLSAEIMFVEQGMTCRAISEMIDVSEPTLSKWRTAGNWDKLRDELLASPHKIKALLMAEFKRIASGEEATLNADAVSKISKAIDALDDKINPRIIIAVIKLLDEWLADVNPQLARENLEWHKKFILQFINQCS